MSRAPRRAQQIPVAQHHRGDAARREREPRGLRSLRGLACSRPRATSRNTSSSVLAAVALQAAAPACRRPRSRPCFMKITRSHSRSTSAMLCEAISMRGAVLVAIALQPRAHPVGGVGIERGGRLVEQQQVRRVDQRLGERDARLLSGRELAGRAVEQIGQFEFARDLDDALRQIARRRRACRTRSGSAGS